MRHFFPVLHSNPVSNAPAGELVNTAHSIGIHFGEE
jgi:hypothetical protein